MLTQVKSPKGLRIAEMRTANIPSPKRTKFFGKIKFD